MSQPEGPTCSALTSRTVYLKPCGKGSVWGLGNSPFFFIFSCCVLADVAVAGALAGPSVFSLLSWAGVPGLGSRRAVLRTQPQSSTWLSQWKLVSKRKETASGCSPHPAPWSGCRDPCCLVLGGRLQPPASGPVPWRGHGEATRGPEMGAVPTRRLALCSHKGMGNGEAFRLKEPWNILDLGKSRAGYT